MSNNRVMVMCLDAFHAPLGDQLIAEGKLPGIKRLKEQSARFELEHGPEGKSRYTGLTWEHFSAGCKPETTGRWSVITWDADAFEARQLNVAEPPFLADMDVKCAIFDPPYWDIAAQSNAVGVVGWSGHDTGCHPTSVPESLMAEIMAKFGPPPSVAELNTMVYPSVEQTRKMADLIIEGTKHRADIAEWFFAERCTDWDVAVLGFGEPHDAIELFCHGIIPDHMLANHPTAAIAREGLIASYIELDRQVSRFMDKFPDCTFVAFTMHGMGFNDTDLPTMLLLPELMYRMQFEQPLFGSREDWVSADVPILRENEDWNGAVIGAMTHPPKGMFEALPERAAGKAKAVAFKALTKVFGEGSGDFLYEKDVMKGEGLQHKSYSVAWMPSAQYSPYWPQMDAFGVPAYFDGRVSINLQGREKFGKVPLEQYHEVLERIKTTLLECVDTRTGEPVIREMETPGVNDPLGLDGTQADIKILWNGSPVGFRHPKYGDIGPAPVRRVGGHSGGYGALYVMGQDIEAGDFGLKSSFDVAPTIVELLGQVRPNRMDGESVLKKDPAEGRLVPVPAE